MWLWAEEFDGGAQVVEYLFKAYLFATLYQSDDSRLEQDVSVLLDGFDELALLLELLSVVSQPFLCAVPIHCEPVLERCDELG